MTDPHHRTLKRQKRDSNTGSRSGSGSTSWNTADETLVDDREEQAMGEEDMGEMMQPTEEHEFARPRYYRNRDAIRQGKRRALETTTTVQCKFAKAG